MRITGGILKGRRILVPKTSVRPTQDRVRAAVFASLGAELVGARVLDIFAGSGALGLEAFSRGASFVCWVERDARVLRVLRENIAQLCGSTDNQKMSTRIVRKDVMRFLRSHEDVTQKCEASQLFDIIFADPPYCMEDDQLKKLLPAISTASILHAGGMLVLEQNSGSSVAAHEGWTLVKNKIYGGTRINFFRKQDKI